MIRYTYALVSVLVLALAFTAGTFGDDKAPVAALPPHPLDSAFAKANTANDATNALLNDPLFKKAVQAAVKAKKDREAAIQKDKALIGPSPAQAARAAFLKVINNEKE